MSLFKRICSLILGIFIIACAINLIIVSRLGATPWDSANFTLAEYFKITPGLATFITGALLTISIEIINYKKFQKQTLNKMLIVIALGFLSGFFINITSPIISDLVPNYKFFGIIGIIVFSIGINFVAIANLPSDPINNFMLKIMFYYNQSINNSRIITDSVAVILALSFGLLLWPNNIFNHYLGIGTIIAFFLLPFCIKVFNKYIFSKISYLLFR